MRWLPTLALTAAAAACSSEGPTAPDRPVTAVAVSPASTSLIVGESAKLTALVTGGFGAQVVAWTSSNTAVATVSDSGIVTARAAGTATIRATAGGVEGSATLTITAGAVDRITLCDRGVEGACSASATLIDIGTAVAVRATAYNRLGADITASCVFQWTPNMANVVTIALSADAARRDALVTRIAGGVFSIIVTCGGTPAVFTILGLAAPAAPGS